MTCQQRRHPQVYCVLIISLLISILGVPGVTHLTAAPAVDIHVLVDGQPLNLDVTPFLDNDRLLVPVRPIAERLGANVQWDGAVQKVIINRDQLEIILLIGDNKAFINGRESFIEAAPRIVEGRTMVPLRFVSEALGAQVEWCGDSREVRIISGSSSATPEAEEEASQPELPVTEYNQPGTYGPEEGQETIAGSIVVGADGVNLHNMVISGDLTISGDVGDGSVSLTNIAVSGTTNIRGGGANSVVLEDYTGELLTVDSPDRPVHVIMQGRSRVSLVMLGSGAFLEERNLTGQGYNEVRIKAGQASSINLAGGFTKISCSSPAVVLKLLSGSIVELNIAGEAAGFLLNLDKGTKIGSVLVDGASDITGAGGIDYLNVYADGTFCAATTIVGTANTGPGLYVSNTPSGRKWSGKRPPIESSDPSIYIWSPSGGDQINWDQRLTLENPYSDTVWSITNCEGAGGTLVGGPGKTIQVLGPEDPAGSHTGSSGSCVVTARSPSIGLSASIRIYIQGNGTQGFPYIIRDGGQLDAIRDGDVPGDGRGNSIPNYTVTDFYKVVADIDLSAYSDWVPLDLEQSFAAGGTGPDFDQYLRFNGYNHRITNLMTSDCGLFGSVDPDIYSDPTSKYNIVDLVIENPLVGAWGATFSPGPLAGHAGKRVIVKNVRVVGGLVLGEDNCSGLVADNEGSIQNCWSSATVNGSGCGAGGLVGANVLEIKDSSFSGAVLTSTNSGGVAGIAGPCSVITNCTASGTVTATTDTAGGLAGMNDGQITNCVSTSVVGGASVLGGLVARNTANGVIDGCGASGDVLGSASDVAGLVALNGGQIRNSSASGIAGGASYVGGLAARNNPAATIDNCQASGFVSASAQYAGGLTAYNAGDISGSQASGQVSSPGDGVGGLVASNVGNIATSHSTGIVEGGLNVGGLVGQNASPGIIYMCYFTGRATGSAGVGGLVGDNLSVIQRSCSMGLAYGTADSVGGLIGINRSATAVVTDCYTQATVTCNSNGDAGGLVGTLADGSVSRCYSAGEVSGSIAGGIAGLASVAGVSIEDCLALNNGINGGAVCYRIGSRAAGSYVNNYALDTMVLHQPLLDPGLTGQDGLGILPVNAADPLWYSSQLPSWDFALVWSLAGGGYPVLIGVPMI